METVTVLGGGISGLATSYFVGHDKCVIYEADSHYGGHVYSEEQGGCIWDDGPHVSYTKNEFIQELFSKLVGGQFEEVQAEIVNYYQGHWIDHPAQSNLYQIPEPLRSRCLASFLEARVEKAAEQTPPTNYEEWIHQAFGRVFADAFPAVYTRKYWTREPADLGTDWIGKRVYYPKIEDVTAGAKAALGRSTYWVNLWRYPTKGGFFNYTHPLFDRKAVEAQQHLWRLQGNRHIYFAGSYFGAGFHEDALQAGLAAAEAVGGVRRPWNVNGESGRIALAPVLEAAE